MSRNANSRFSLNPTNLDISRSRFDRSSSVKTSFNVGDVIPFYVDEVLPGDTFKISTSKVCRMQPLVTPIMDNVYLDTYYFFVPNRLVWEHWQDFCGENSSSPWIPQVEYSIPQITAPEGGWAIGTIADYMGVPTGVANLSVSALPFRAYALIMNDWFRDENLLDPLNIPVTDATQTGSNGDNYVSAVALGGKPFIAAKYHDYFTSCLPSPQKGPDVSIGLVGNVDIVSDGTAPTYSFSDASGNIVGVPIDSSGPIGNNVTWSDTVRFHRPDDVVTTNLTPNSPFVLTNSGLTGELSSVNAVTINQLRLAFQLQRLYEKDARGGTRYIEVLKSHFGVTSPDARLQRPEYLGGNRIPVQINQVVQTSNTVSDSPQGNTAAYSQTVDSHRDFTRSFVEHGYVIGLMVARYDHTYQQGLARHWSRKTRFDYYWPVLANIGEQGVKNKEIYAQGTSADDEIFGYQEAWADYRYKPSIVTGEMRSSYATSLDVWHLADDYNTLPTLSPSWIQEDKSTLDRCLAVTSSVSNQLWADIYIKCSCTRPMPLYSIPGLIDHH